MIPSDLPSDMPSFLARFGSDTQCRAYLFEARWPAGFLCSGRGHGAAYVHKQRLIYECAQCGKQHSLLAADEDGPFALVPGDLLQAGPVGG